jgi:signal recognition particle receptor subunit beta
LLISSSATHFRLLPETLIEHAHVPPEAITQLTDPTSEQILEHLRQAARDTSGLLFVHWAAPVHRSDGGQLIMTSDGSVEWQVVLDELEQCVGNAAVIMHTGDGIQLPARGTVSSKVYQLSTQPHHIANFEDILVHGLASGPPQLSIEDIYVGLHQASLADRRTVPSRIGSGSRLIIVPNRAEPRPATPDSLSRVTSCKIAILGGFGTGKTTAIGSISEITPLTTEAIMTGASVGIDDNRQVPGKTTLTVAMDFGRVSIDRDLIVYLFGPPGADRFWFNWDEIVRGCVGAVVLIDTRRLADSFAPIDFVERRGLPFAIAINCFDGLQYHAAEDVREALSITPDVPVLAIDVRSRQPVKNLLITLIEHLLERRKG